MEERGVSRGTSGPAKLIRTKPSPAKPLPVASSLTASSSMNTYTTSSGSSQTSSHSLEADIRELIASKDLDLETELIAHDCNVQALFEQKHISWAVQLALARGVLNGDWEWDQITAAKLDLLSGETADALPSVRSVMKTGFRATTPSGNLVNIG